MERSALLEQQIDAAERYHGLSYTPRRARLFRQHEAEWRKIEALLRDEGELPSRYHFLGLRIDRDAWFQAVTGYDSELDLLEAREAAWKAYRRLVVRHPWARREIRTAEESFIRLETAHIVS